MLSNPPVLYIPDTMPESALAITTSGTVAAVWLQNTGSTTASVPVEIYSTIKNGTNSFAVPSPIATNNVMEGRPALAFADAGTLYATWVQNIDESSYSSTATLADILLNQDVYWSKYSVTSGSWSAPQNIMNETGANVRADGYPSIAFSNAGNGLICWTRYTSATLSTASTLSAEIFYAAISTSGSVSTAASLTSNSVADYEPVVSSVKDKLMTLWLRDTDGSDNTYSDMSLQYAVWNGTQWTTSATLISSPNGVIAKYAATGIKGDSLLAVWVVRSTSASTSTSTISNSYLNYAFWNSTTGVWSVPATAAVLSTDLVNLQLNCSQKNILAATWKEGRGVGSSISGCFMDLKASQKQWTLPRIIEYDSLYNLIPSCAIEADTLRLLWLRTQISSSANYTNPSNFFASNLTYNGSTDGSISVGYVFAPDIAIMQDSIQTSTTAYTLGEPLNITVPLTNLGVIASTSTTVKLLRGNSVTTATLVSTATLSALFPDQVVSVTFSVLSVGGTNALWIVADPNNVVFENNENNNSTLFTFDCGADITISAMYLDSASYFIGATTSVYAVISNVYGSTASNVRVEFQKQINDSTWTTLATVTVASIAPGTSQTVSFNWVVTGGTTALAVVADPERLLHEANPYNNSESLFSYVYPDLSFGTNSSISIGSTQAVVTVWNTGRDACSSGATLSIWDSSSNLTTASMLAQCPIPALPINSSATLTLNYLLPNGVFDVHVILDYGNAIRELNKLNNDTSIKTFNAIKTDVALYNYDIWATSTNATATTGTLFVRVRNLSTMGVGGVVMSVFAGTVATTSLIANTVIPLVQGNNFTITSFASISLSSMPIVVQLDPDNLIAETNKLNNTATSIASPIQIVSPSGGETLYAESTATIIWTTTGATISQVNLSYSTGNSVSWTTIATAVTNTGSYLWNVPISPTTQAVVKIDATLYPQISTSGNYFTISRMNRAKIKVFLEGAFIATSGTMQILRDLMPLIDPYTCLVTVGTIPANVTDWLNIELRSTSDNTQVFKNAICFLRNDGVILDLDGSEGVRILPENLLTAKYYLVVQHRNHLKIMSAQPVALTYDSPLYDFTSSQNQAYPADGSSLKQIATGVFGMIAGDASANGYINAVDRAQIRNSSGIIGYSQQDVSLDGIVNGVDRVISINNMFRIMQVP